MGFFKVFRLAKRGPSNRGLVCDADGVMLGPVPLISAIGDGALGKSRIFRAIGPDELANVLWVAYGPDFDLHCAYRTSILKAIELALNEGRFTQATIATLHLRLPELTPEAAENLITLAKYNPNQPRDWRGRWTLEDSGPSTSETEQPNWPITASLDSLNRCIEECYEKLNRPVPYKWSDLARYDFLRCVKECRQRYQ